VDDWEICDDDGYKGLAAGPEAAADCAFWTGLEGCALVRGFFDVLDDGKTYGQDRYGTDGACEYDEHSAAE